MEVKILRNDGTPKGKRTWRAAGHSREEGMENEGKREWRLGTREQGIGNRE
jgi:hypothetical protein